MAYPVGQAGRPVFLQQFKTRFDATGVIGETQTGWLCSRRGDVVWSPSSAALLMPAPPMVSRFRAEMNKANYPVPVVSDSMFPEEKKEPADDIKGKDRLQVGAMVKETLINLCAKSTTGTGTWTGEAYVKIFWQVYAPEQKKVVFETTTEGLYKLPSSGNPVSHPTVITAAAFAVAARNMMADPGYQKAIMTPADPVLMAAMAAGKAASAPGEKLRIDGAVADSQPLPQKVTQLRAAVATVVGEMGSGSGFFVGRDGLLLTNQHVVGNTKFVKVKLATGRELVGEVLRSDAARDVALIKTEQPGILPLPVRGNDPAIGEDVYALGSPLGEQFNTTLTKGILGGFREINKQNFLQSDVAVLPGNSGGPLLDGTGRVIGITVMGLGAKGLAGMNFFVPVGDALEKLGVTMAAK